MPGAIGPPYVNVGGPPTSVWADVWLSGVSASTEARYPPDPGGAATVNDPSEFVCTKLAGAPSNTIRVPGPRFVPAIFTTEFPWPSVLPDTEEIDGGPEVTTVNADGRTYKSPFSVTASAVGVRVVTGPA